MKLAHPAVFLFGAGATRGAFNSNSIPPPLDSDFFEIAGHIKGHGTQKLVSKVLKDVWALYGTTSGIGLEYYYRDIETRQRIGTFAKAANKPKNWEKRKKDLDELIRRVIIHTTCEEENGSYRQKPSLIHKRILASLDKTDTLITFNYDLVIEESFGINPMWSPRDGYGGLIHGITGEWCSRWFFEKNRNTKTSSKVQLLKLHGSINWDQYDSGGLKLKDRPFRLRTKKQKVLPESVAILPPGWNKAIYKKPYKSLWQQARLDLENCAALVILGYSLPETDLLARALFSEVIRHRAEAKYGNLKQLYLCDPADVVRLRMDNLFRPTLNSNSRIFRFDGIQAFSKAIFDSR